MEKKNKVKEEEPEQKPTEIYTMEDLRNISASLNRSVELLHVFRVKSYAPSIGHYVFDIRVE